MAEDRVLEWYRGVCRQSTEEAFASKCGEGVRVAVASGDNPLCGDSMKMMFALDASSGEVVDAAWEGYGCSLCIASAEALLSAAMGRQASEMEQLNRDFVLSLLGEPRTGKSRLHCVELPILVAKEALETC